MGLLSEVVPQYGLVIHDAAWEVGYSSYYLADLARKGRIHAVKIDGTWVIPTPEIERLSSAAGPITRRTFQFVCAAPDCDRRFASARATHQYCSKACQHRHRAGVVRVERAVVCADVGCGRSFVTVNNDQRFCSRACQQKTAQRLRRRVARGVRACDNPRCRVVFSPSTTRQRFCAEPCRRAAARRRAHASPQARCANGRCAQLFLPGRSDQRFCSTTCWEQHRYWRDRPCPDRPCARCGAVFHPTRRDQRFCATACKQAAYRASRRRAA